MTRDPGSTQSFPGRAADTVASVAMDMLEHVRRRVFGRKPADVAVARYFARHRELGSRDRHFLSDLTFSYFRWRGWFMSGGEDLALAAAIGYALDARACPDVLGNLIRKSAIPTPVAIVPMGGRDLDERRLWVEDILHRSCHWEDLVPSWVPSQLAPPENDPDHARRCIRAFQIRPPIWLYALRGGCDELLGLLASAGVPATSHPVLAGAIGVSEPIPFGSLPRDMRRRFIVQDLASQCVVAVCAPKPGERWLDVCAGAGGKTIHLADRMKDAGDVAATDVRAQALRELYRRVREAGLSSVRIGAGTGAADCDGVLVDAPCSGLGTWGRNPDARWRVRQADIGWAQKRQKEILAHAARRVRPGGALVYSVCTLTPPETSDVVNEFVGTHPDWALDPFEHPLDGATTPGYAWVWPWDGPCGGMFIARFRRAP